MNTSAYKLIGPALAAAGSLAALAYSADAVRSTEGIAAAPFGWYRVMVVHVLATLPLSWAIADTMAMRVHVLGQRRCLGVWIVLGVAVGLASLGIGPFFGAALDVVGSGFLTRLLVRTGWCVVLQIPWCLAGRSLEAAPSLETPSLETPPFETPPRELRRPVAQLNLFAWSLAVALAMPASYLDKLIDEQTDVAFRHWGEDHFLRAWKITFRLCDLGSEQRLGESSGADSADTPSSDGMALRVARDQLAQSIAAAQEEIKRLEKLQRNDAQRRLLAGLLATVDRLEEAKSEIEPLAERNAEAALTLARFLQEQRHWQQSSEWLRKALDLASTERSERTGDTAVSDAGVALVRQAYNALVFNARKMHHAATADRFYFEAIERLPEQEAYFQFRLGRYYEIEGRPRLAVEHFEKAHRLDSTYEKPTGVLTRILSNNTPVGLFSPSASSHP